MDTFHIFLVVIRPILEMTAVVLFAYLLVKKKWLSLRLHGLMSKTVLYVCLPLLLFAKLAGATDLLARYPRWYLLPLSAWIIYAAGALIGLGVAMLALRKRQERTVCAIMSGFHNAGYLPLVIMVEVFGEAPHLDVLVMIYVIGSATMLWTVSPAALGGGGLRWSNLRKVINPPIIAVLCGLGAMLLGLGGWLETIPVGRWNLSVLLLTPMALIGEAAIPLILMVLGGILAQLPTAVWKNRRFVTTVVLSKLVALPLIGLLVIPRLGLDPHLALVLMVATMTPPALNLTVQAREFGDETTRELVGEGLLFTYLASVLTLTLFLTVVKMIG